MKWLTIFFASAFVVGDLLFVSASHWLDGNRSSMSMLSGTLAMDALFLFPTVAVATVVRMVFGRLSGFAGGVIGLVCGEVVVATAVGFGIGFYNRELCWHGAQCLAAILLSHLPIFRDRALSLSPPAGIRGLSRTSAFVIPKGDSVASALGVRCAAERRWATAGLPAPIRWDGTASALGTAPRALPRRLVWALALGAQTAPYWRTIASGVSAAAIWIWASVLILRLDLGDLEIYPLIPPIVGLALLRFAGLRLLQSCRLAQLLRAGELVIGARDPVTIANRRRDVVVIVPFGEERIAVQTREPLEPTTGQAFLVDRVKRQIVAWDLLPFVPSVAEDGSLVVPPFQVLVPGLLRLLALLLATTVAAVLWVHEQWAIEHAVRVPLIMGWFFDLTRRLGGGLGAPA